MISEAVAPAFSCESRSLGAQWCVVFVVGSALACPRTIQASRSVVSRYLALQGPLSQLDLERSLQERESRIERSVNGLRAGRYSRPTLLEDSQSSIQL